MSTDFTFPEILACTLAREIRTKGSVVADGSSPVAVAAARLALLTNARSAQLLITGANKDAAIPHSSVGRNQRTHCATSISEIERALSRHSKANRSEQVIGCFAASRLDRFGNMTANNPQHVHLRPEAPGPGTAGLYFARRLERIFYLVEEHSPRVLSDHVDYISMPGSTLLRRQFCTVGSRGLMRCVTPLCVFRFDEYGEMVVHSLHPGITEEMVLERTGWPVKFESALLETAAPTATELTLLRTVVELGGIVSGDEAT